MAASSERHARVEVRAISNATRSSVEHDHEASEPSSGTTTLVGASIVGARAIAFDVVPLESTLKQIGSR
jgi:hypothetical protein